MANGNNREEEQFGVQSVINAPDPATEAFANVLRRQRQGDFVSSSQRNQTTRNRLVPQTLRGGRTPTSPVGEAFGTLASLGIAKLLGANLKARQNLAIAAEREKAGQTLEERKIGVRERGIESEIAGREAAGIRAEKGLGFQEAGVRLQRERFEAEKGREERGIIREEDQRNLDIILKTGQGLKKDSPLGKGTGLTQDIPARQQPLTKQQELFIEGLDEEIDFLRNVRVRTPEEDARLVRLQQERLTAVGAPISLSPEGEIVDIPRGQARASFVDLLKQGLDVEEVTRQSEQGLGVGGSTGPAPQQQQRFDELTQAINDIESQENLNPAEQALLFDLKEERFGLSPNAQIEQPVGIPLIETGRPRFPGDTSVIGERPGFDIGVEGVTREEQDLFDRLLAENPNLNPQVLARRALR